MQDTLTRPAVVKPVAALDLPDREASRIGVIDVLRGFALCGILLIHVPIFSQPGAPPGFAHSGSLFDGLLLYGLIFFVEAKFFSLFAALFGIGFAVQWQSAEAKGQPFVPRFRRRLLLLGLFGALHATLLWESDILLLYALVGLLLIPLRNAPPEKLLRWAVWLLAVPLAVYLLALGGLALAQLDPDSAERIREAEAQFSTSFAAERGAVAARYALTDPVQALVQRTLDYLSSSALLLTRVPSVLAMFLLGFYVGKRNLLRDVGAHLPLLRRVRAWGLGVGLPASLLVTLAYSQLSPFAALTSLGVNQVFAGPVLALGYAATLVLLVRHPLWQRLLGRLASYGRMALTNYLLQSALCGLLFYGYGLGLVQRVSPLQALGLALALNVALIGLSVLWLRHFRMGPAEWLWRTLTMGQAQPLRLTRREPQRRPAPAGTAYAWMANVRRVAARAGRRNAFWALQSTYSRLARVAVPARRDARYRGRPFDRRRAY